MLECEEVEAEEYEEVWLVVELECARKGGRARSGSVSVDKTSSAGERGEFAVETAAVRGPGSFSCEMSFLRRRLPELGKNRNEKQTIVRPEWHLALNCPIRARHNSMGIMYRQS